MHQKTRSRTGCRTCRIRKVKCDEEKIPQDHGEPRCRRCLAARILCEWKGGPIPRSTRSAKGVPRGGPTATIRNARTRSHLHSTSQPQPLSPWISEIGAQSHHVQAANSLTLSEFDRQCLNYLQDSILVVILGKHWPWSTVSYAYHKIATREPMMMSMMLASAAREIHRSKLYNMDHSDRFLSEGRSDMDGTVHYGQALAGLREALKQEVRSPQQIEAIFITLWLMIDYENRFGSGASAINIHIRGIETLLHNHIVPSLQYHALSAISDVQQSPRRPQPNDGGSLCESIELLNSAPGPASAYGNGLGGTSVPLFLLWTLYFFTPAAPSFGSGTAPLDTDIFRFFLRSETENTALSLAELYSLSRQSPARFWGEGYPVSSQLDDLENFPGLTLYHRSHVLQVEIAEIFQKHPRSEISLGEESTYQRVMNEILTLSVEYDTVLTMAQKAPSCDIAGDRRVIETVLWSAITYYGTIVYFHICFQDLGESLGTQNNTNLIPLHSAVSQVLDLSLKLHRSRPRLMVRITWPLFIAGIAASDRIYQDWVSFRLQELRRYGQNYERISRRFDEIIQGGPPYSHEKGRVHYLGGQSIGCI